MFNEELLRQHNKIMKFLQQKSIRKLSNTQQANQIWLRFGGFYITDIGYDRYYSFNVDWVKENENENTN